MKHKRLALSVLSTLIISSNAYLPAASAAAGDGMFADVPTNHWAYEAVMQLKSAGLVNGISANKFDGEQKVTRYQMSKLVANALSHQELASNENKATMDKLAAEFADELKSLEKLSKRVGDLEKHKKGVADNFTVHGHFQQTVEAKNHAGGDTQKSRWWAKEFYLDAQAKIPKLKGDWKFTTQLVTKLGGDRFNEEKLMSNDNASTYNGGHKRDEVMRPNLYYFEGSLGDTGLYTRVGDFSPWVQNGYVMASNIQGVMVERYGEKNSWHAFAGRLDSSDSDLAVGVEANYTGGTDNNGWSRKASQAWNDNVRAHPNYQIINNAATNWTPAISYDGVNPVSPEEEKNLLENGGTGSDNAKSSIQGAGFNANKDTVKTAYGFAWDHKFDNRLSGSIGGYRYTSAAYGRKPLYIGAVSMDYSLTGNVLLRGTYSQGNQHGANSNSRGYMIDLMYDCNPWMGAETAHQFGAYIGYHVLAPDSYIRCGYGDEIEKGVKGVAMGVYYNFTNNLQFTVKYGFGTSMTNENQKRDKFYSGLYCYF